MCVTIKCGHEEVFRLLMDETNRRTVNFQFLLVAQYQSRCTADNAPDDGQENCPKHVEQKQSVTELHKMYQSPCTADNAPDDEQKTARNMYSHCAINKNWKFTVHLLVSSISNLRDAQSYNPKVTSLSIFARPTEKGNEQGTTPYILL